MDDIDEIYETETIAVKVLRPFPCWLLHLQPVTISTISSDVEVDLVQIPYKCLHTGEMKYFSVSRLFIWSAPAL